VDDAAAVVRVVDDAKGAGGRRGRQVGTPNARGMAVLVSATHIDGMGSIVSWRGTVPAPRMPSYPLGRLLKVI
jgi:hypothetical protein